MDTSQPRHTDHLSFDLHAVAATVACDEILDDPRLARLIVEDACWDLALTSWSYREPTGVHWLAKRRWYTEGKALFDERDRIAFLARRCGLSV